MNLPFRNLALVAALTLPVSALAFDFLGRSEPPSVTKVSYSAPKATTGRTPSGGVIDRIVVKKGERRLYLMRGDDPFRSYKISLGYQPTGHKRYKGDGRTPEGIYFLDWRSDQSSYHKALHISYPNMQDRLRAVRKGEDPGGMIMIHGQPTGRGEMRSGDWTFGCIAVSDLAIDEIWTYAKDGTTVEILP